MKQANMVDQTRPPSSIAPCSSSDVDDLGHGHGSASCDVLCVETPFFLS